MTNDLEVRYNAYLTTVNERRLDDLVQHVHEELTFNGSPMTIQQYQGLIAATVNAMPDISFKPQLLVVGIEKSGTLMPLTRFTVRSRRRAPAPVRRQHRTDPVQSAG